MRDAYAEAAFRPRPREPPVTTATLPLRLKRDGKSLRLTSSMMASCPCGEVVFSVLYCVLS